LQTGRGVAFPPVQLSSLDVTPFSIELRVPSPVSDELEQYATDDGCSWEKAAENALMFFRESFMTREDHAKENIEWAVRNFGPSSGTSFRSR
jgi:hypothetical protein